MRRLLVPLAAVLIALALGVGAHAAGLAPRPAATPTAATCVSADFRRDCATGAEYPYPGPGLPAVATVAP